MEASCPELGLPSPYSCPVQIMFYSVLITEELVAVGLNTDVREPCYVSPVRIVSAAGICFLQGHNSSYSFHN
jgi:hypothetical protein